MFDIYERALDLIYPPRCPVCDGVLPVMEFRGGKLLPQRRFHRECREVFYPVTGRTCLKCGKSLAKRETDELCTDCLQAGHIYDRGFPVFEYRSVAGSLYRFKYMGRQEYAGGYADAAVKRYGSVLKSLGIDALIPVPMYAQKENKRGYNQAAVFAKALSKRLGIPCKEHLLKRVRNTTPMKGLDAAGRRNNLKKAFIMARNDVKFRCVLIIDDIYTTGSTIDAIAHEFRMAGVEKIYFLTLAVGQTT